MEHEPLKKPRDGIHFWIWRLMLSLNWARDWTWAQDVDGIRRTELAAICLVQKQGKSGSLNALSLTLGPLKVMIGIGA